MDRLESKGFDLRFKIENISHDIFGIKNPFKQKISTKKRSKETIGRAVQEQAGSLSKKNKILYFQKINLIHNPFLLFRIIVFIYLNIFFHLIFFSFIKL